MTVEVAQKRCDRRVREDSEIIGWLQANATWKRYSADVAATSNPREGTAVWTQEEVAVCAKALLLIVPLW